MTASAEAPEDEALQDAAGFVVAKRLALVEAIAEQNVAASLRLCVSVAGELRTSLLGPARYFRLYKLVLGELHRLAALLADVASQGEDLQPVYEAVQGEGNALPRLYILVTVGFVCALHADTVQAELLIDDLASLLLAVQHPMRGLFLRYYFLQCSKDVLARLGAPVALRHMLQNFRECVSLWARLRLEDQSLRRDTSAVDSGEAWQLDPKMHALRFLVCAPLMHLADLPDLSFQLYREALLPDLLRLCTTCEDVAGQAFLLQSLVEVFPADFHAKTVEPLLAACAQVQWAVDLNGLVQHLLRWLSGHVKRDASAESVDIFGSFYSHAQLLHARQCSPVAKPLPSLLGLQFELMLAALSLHPEGPHHVELVLTSTAELVEQRTGSLCQRAAELLIDILAAPLTQDALVAPVLAMPHHGRLIAALPRESRRPMARALLDALHEGGAHIPDCAAMSRLLTLVEPLLGDAGADHDEAAFAAEQRAVARLVQQALRAEPGAALAMLAAMRDRFATGGAERRAYTAPAVAAAALRLMARDGGREARELAVEAVEAVGPGPGGLHLWLLGLAMVATDGRAVSGGDLHEAVGTFLVGALGCLEGDAAHSRLDLVSLEMLVGTLLSAPRIPADLYDDAADEALGLAARLPSRRLQALGHCHVAKLFARGPRAAECLQTAMRCADHAIHTDALDVDVFVDILDVATYVFERQGENGPLTPAALSCIVSVCRQHVACLGALAPEESVRGLRLLIEDLRSRRSAALPGDLFERLPLDALELP